MESDEYCDECADFDCRGHGLCGECHGDICNDCLGCDCSDFECPGYVAHATGN